MKLIHRLTQSLQLFSDLHWFPFQIKDDLVISIILMLKGIGWQKSVACLINIADSYHSTYSPLDFFC